MSFLSKNIRIIHLLFRGVSTFGVKLSLWNMLFFLLFSDWGFC